MRNYWLLNWMVVASALAGWAPAPGFAQRVIFPTQAQGPAPPSPFVGDGVPVQLDGSIQPTAPAWDPYADPALQAPPTLPYGAPGSGSPAYGPPPGYAAPGYAPPPYPGAYPADPYAPYGWTAPFRNPMRFLQEIYFEQTWLAGSGGSDFDINTTEMSASFGLPFLGNPSPLLVTPGFVFNFWDGPDTAATGAELPPRVYDAWLDTSWQPVITPWLSADLAVRVGVYSDFEEFTSDSLRVTGRGIGLINFNPQVQLALGVAYINRDKIKLLPVAGVIWTPNADARWEILFPRPKLSTRLTTWGNSDVWVYVGGEYGGGNWTFESTAGLGEVVNYNDIRVFGGLEVFAFNGVKGHFEVGYVFNREILYRSTMPDVFPDDTVMLRAGISY